MKVWYETVDRSWYGKEAEKGITCCVVSIL